MKTKNREMIKCSECGTGPFFLVPDREFPRLCLDCSDEKKREKHGWTVENSID